MNVACSFVSQFFSLVTREGQTSTVGGDDMAPSLLIILRAVNNQQQLFFSGFFPKLSKTLCERTCGQLSGKSLSSES